MPIYEYRCGKCGVFEAMQKITDEPLVQCPTCRRKVSKLISRNAFQLKGSGWYVTDYARKQDGQAAAGEKADGENTDGKKAGSEKAGTATTGEDAAPEVSGAAATASNPGSKDGKSAGTPKKKAGQKVAAA